MKLRRKNDYSISKLSTFKSFSNKNYKKNNTFCHIRIQQRNGRKSLTLIQGLCEKLDVEKITKTLKKEFCCNGSIIEDLTLGKIIQLQGDQRENVLKFILEEEIVAKRMIKVHGI